jgi:hypothetical protein
MYSGEQLDKRRFARTIFADDRVNLARFELKINVLKCVRRSEALIQALKDQKRLSTGRCASIDITAALFRWIHLLVGGYEPFERRSLSTPGLFDLGAQ